MNNTDHYYESLRLSYQLPSSTTNNNQRPLPLRKAPLPPIVSPSPQPVLTATGNANNNNHNNYNSGTLSHYHNEYCVGIPFVLHPIFSKMTHVDFQIPKCNDSPTDTLDYDFNLERQILCSTRDEKRKSTSNNPFF